MAPGSSRVLFTSLALFFALALAGPGCTPSADSPGAGDGSGGSAATGSGGSGSGTGGGVVSGGGSGNTGGAGGSAGSPANTGGDSGGGNTGGSPQPPGTGGASGSDAAAPADSGAGKPDRIPMPTGVGKIVLIAGGGNGGDGTPAKMASTNKPFGVAIDPMNGDVYIAEYGSSSVRRIDDKGIITTVMGAGAMGPGGKISLKQPHGLMFQPNSRNLYVANTFGGTLVKMDAATGESTVVMNGGRPYCVSFDAAGERMYVNANGITMTDLKTMAKTNVGGGSRTFAVDSKGNVYMGGGATLSVADPMGKISNVMGGGGLSGPKHLFADLDDNIIIADTESDTILKYTVATKMVTKIAGGGGGALDGPPEMAKMARPHGVFVDAQGRIWIADSFNNRILRIDY